MSGQWNAGEIAQSTEWFNSLWDFLIRASNEWFNSLWNFLTWASTDWFNSLWNFPTWASIEWFNSLTWARKCTVAVAEAECPIRPHMRVLLIFQCFCKIRGEYPLILARESPIRFFSFQLPKDLLHMQQKAHKSDTFFHLHPRDWTFGQFSHGKSEDEVKGWVWMEPRTHSAWNMSWLTSGWEPPGHFVHPCSPTPPPCKLFCSHWECIPAQGGLNYSHLYALNKVLVCLFHDEVVVSLSHDETHDEVTCLFLPWRGSCQLVPWWNTWWDNLSVSPMKRQLSACPMMRKLSACPTMRVVACPMMRVVVCFFHIQAVTSSSHDETVVCFSHVESSCLLVPWWSSCLLVPWWGSCQLVPWWNTWWGNLSVSPMKRQWSACPMMRKLSVCPTMRVVACPMMRVVVCFFHIQTVTSLSHDETVVCFSHA